MAEVRPETPSVKTFRLAFAEGVDFSFIPGQFAMVAFPAEPDQTRAYSLASSPLDKGHIEIAFAKAGAFTARMFELKEGDKLLVEGPYGRWLYKDDVEHAVCLCGGTGITPFRSMIRYVTQKKLPNRLTLLYSSKTADDIVFRNETHEWAENKNVKIVQTLTRPGIADLTGAWDGRTGRLSLDVIKEEVPDFAAATFYMCGPNQFVADLAKALEGAGIPKERIRYEKWGEF